MQHDFSATSKTYQGPECQPIWLCLWPCISLSIRTFYGQLSGHWIASICTKSWQPCANLDTHQCREWSVCCSGQEGQKRRSLRRIPSEAFHCRQPESNLLEPLITFPIWLTELQFFKPILRQTAGSSWIAFWCNSQSSKRKNKPKEYPQQQGRSGPTIFQRTWCMQRFLLDIRWIRMYDSLRIISRTLVHPHDTVCVRLVRSCV